MKICVIDNLVENVMKCFPEKENSSLRSFLYDFADKIIKHNEKQIEHLETMNSYLEDEVKELNTKISILQSCISDYELQENY